MGGPGLDAPLFHGEIKHKYAQSPSALDQECMFALISLSVLGVRFLVFDSFALRISAARTALQVQCAMIVVFLYLILQHVHSFRHVWY